MEYNLIYLFAAACVATYAHERFNTPKPLRATTTATQYYLALSGYMVSALGVFLGLTLTLEANAQTREFLKQISGMAELGRDVVNLPAPLFSALFLTVLLPRIPMLRKVDTSMQRLFQDLGSIPHKALRLSWKLRHQPFQIPVARLDNVKNRLTSLELDADFMLDAPAGSVEAEWVRIVALYSILEEKVESKVKPRFMRDQQLHHKEIRCGYERLAEVVAVMMRLKTEQPRLAKGFQNDCRILLKQLTELISRGVLQSERGMKAAHTELGTWGFTTMDSPQKTISCDELVGIVLAIMVYMSAFFIVVAGGSNDIAKKLSLAFTIALSLGGAVAFATLPKPVWGQFANRDSDGQRPYSFYVTASLLAAGFWFVVQTARFLLENGGTLDAAIDHVLDRRPWALMPMATAFAIAWFADNDPSSWIVPERMIRWMEGFMQAVVMMITLAVVLPWLQARGILMSSKAPLPIMLLSVGGVGFIVGWLAPSLYRRLREESEQERDMDEAEPAPSSQRSPVSVQRYSVNPFSTSTKVSG